MVVPFRGLRSGRCLWHRAPYPQGTSAQQHWLTLLRAVSCLVDWRGLLQGCTCPDSTSMLLLLLSLLGLGMKAVMISSNMYLCFVHVYDRLHYPLASVRAITSTLRERPRVVGLLIRHASGCFFFMFAVRVRWGTPTRVNDRPLSWLSILSIRICIIGTNHAARRCFMFERTGRLLRPRLLPDCAQACTSSSLEIILVRVLGTRFSTSDCPLDDFVGRVCVERDHIQVNSGAFGGAWVPDDLNNGHLESYFCLITGLVVARCALPGSLTEKVRGMFTVFFLCRETDGYFKTSWSFVNDQAFGIRHTSCSSPLLFEIIFSNVVPGSTVILPWVSHIFILQERAEQVQYRGCLGRSMFDEQGERTTARDFGAPLKLLNIHKMQQSEDLAGMREA